VESRHLYRSITTGGLKENIFGGLTRREFIGYCTALAAALGLSSSYAPKIAKALEEIPKKTPIFWIQSQVCSGCFVSFLNSSAPAPTDLILDSISIRFSPNLQTVSGDLALDTLDAGLNELGKHYVLIVEGAVPLKEGGSFAQYGYKNGQKGSILNWVRKMAARAELIVGLGTCASFGGIPASGKTGAKSLKTVLDSSLVESALVDIPGCPPHPDWLVGTLVKLELFGKEEVLKNLDQHRRPKDFYGELVHDQCPRRHFFEAGKFTSDWNDPTQAGYCLFKKGCKGPVTRADCPVRQWNGGLSWCVEVNHPCIGCTEPQFYQDLSPLYESLPDVSLLGQRLRPETIGKVLGAATAIGIGGHLMEMVATGKLPKRDQKPKKPTDLSSDQSDD